MAYFSKLPYLVLSLNDNYDFIDIGKLEYGNIDDFKDKKMFEKLLKEFVKNFNYELFFKSNSKLYEKIIDAYKKTLNSYITISEDIFYEFYGYKIGNMKVILYNFFQGSFGIKTESDVINFNMVKNISKIPNEYKFSTSFIGIFFHEFSHPYCNPLSYKYFKNINIDNLINFSISRGLQVFYTNKDSYVSEYIVRAITSYLIRKYTKEEYYLIDLENNKNKGFVYIDELVKLIDKKINILILKNFIRKKLLVFFLI